MARLSALEIYRVARAAGFDRDEAVTWTAIAMAESGGNPRAHATSGEDSRGLWQINLNAHKNTWGDLYDPLTNARAAYDVSRGGASTQPWTVTHARNRGTTRDYRQYLDDAEAASRQDPGGRGGGGDDLPPPGNGRIGGGDVGSLSFQGIQHSGPCCQPVSDSKLVDTFGAPRSGGRKHMGIDIFADEGTPIHAITGGKVVQGFDGGALGGVVVRIQGDDGRYYYYAHLKEGSTNHLEVGQRVNAGQVIGDVGKTGNAATTPAHLHLQVREDGEWINPYTFLKELPDIEDVVGPGPLEPQDPFAIDRGAPPSVADIDHDGLTDDFESIFGTSPTLVDTDSDGLSDAYETGTSHTDPLSADTDRDTIPDAVEIARGSDAGLAAIPEAARARGFGGMATMDSDSDGLSDAYEQRIGTDAKAADSDSDALGDATEAASGSDPLRLDSDSDGLSDGFEAAAGTLTAVPRGPGSAAAGGVPGDPAADLAVAGVPGSGADDDALDPGGPGVNP